MLKSQRPGKGAGVPVCLRVVTMVGALLLALASAGCAVEEGHWRPLNDGWDYAWPGSQQIPIGEVPDVDRGEETWKPIRYPGQPPDRAGRTVMWLRHRIPVEVGHYRDPTLVIEAVDQSFLAWAGRRQIYGFGDVFSPATVAIIAGSRVHTIPLPTDSAGDWLVLGVSSRHDNIGPYGNIFFGERADVARAIVWKNLPRFALVAALCCGGLALFLVMALHRVWKLFGPLALFMFAVALALSTSSTGQHVFLNAPFESAFFGLVGMYPVMVPLWLFLADSLSFGRRLLRRVAGGTLAFAIVALFLEASGFVPRMSTILPWQVLVILSTVLLVSVVTREVRSGSAAGKTLAVGVGVIGVGFAYEILYGLQLVDRIAFAIEGGVAAFIGSLAWIAGLHVRDIHRERVRALEAQSAAQQQTLRVAEENLRLREQRQKMLETIADEGQRIAAQRDYAALAAQLPESFSRVAQTPLTARLWLSSSVFVGREMREGFFPLNAAGVPEDANGFPSEGELLRVEDSRNGAVLAYVELARGGDAELLRPLANSVAAAITRARLEQTLHLLERQTRTIRTIVANVNVGILMVDESLRVLPDHSSFLETLFGTRQIVGRPLVEFLAEHCDIDAESQARIRVLLDACIGFPADCGEVNRKSLPRVFHSRVGERVLEADWIAVTGANEQVEAFMLILHDTTELRRMWAEAEAHEEELHLLFEVMEVEGPAFRSFGESAKELLGGIARQISQATPDWAMVRRRLHALKGNCSALGFTRLTKAVHEAEDSLAEGSFPEALARVEKVLARYVEVRVSRSAALGETATPAVAPTSLHDLLGELERSLKIVAAEQGLPAPEVFVAADCDWCFPDDIASTLRACLNQLARNSVAHAFGELQHPSVTCTICTTGDFAELTYEDNGPGLDLARLAELAGSAALSDEELAEQVFRAGVSTVREATEIAGRGIGMDVVRECLAELGGGFEIEFSGPRSGEGRRPFRQRLRIPRQLLLGVLRWAG